MGCAQNGSLSFPHSTQNPPQTPTAQPGPSRLATARANVTPTHYNIDVTFDPEKHSLRATAAVTLRVTEKTAAIEFELNRHLTIRSVTDDAGRALEFIRSGRLNSHKLLVRLAEPAAPESHITLTFTYEGALPSGPLDYITSDGILLRDESRWYPATDLSAWATHVARITMPDGWIAVIGGGLTNYLPSERGKSPFIFRWKARQPVSSRGLAAAKRAWCSPLVPGQPLHRRAGIQFTFFCTSRNTWGRPESKVELIRNWLAQLIQPKPTDLLEKLRVAELQAEPRKDTAKDSEEEPDAPAVMQGEFTLLEGFPGQPGAIGYSAPGFLVVSEDVVKWHDYPGFAPEFLPHEIAHQWFPIEVTLKGEEDGWLAESLAEYLAWCYLAEKQPTDARRMVERAMRDTLAHQPLRPLRLGLKMFALENWDVTRATLYERGMLVFRTLETVIDRERVDHALREYYRRFRGGPASIAGFRKICEAISGRDLGWFFDYYLDGTALPEIALRRLPSSAPNELAGEIVVRNAPPEFQVRVEMRITTAAGVIEHSVATRGEVTPFAMDVHAPVTAVALDPNLRILRVTEPARRHHAQRAQLEAIPFMEAEDSSPASLRTVVNGFESALNLDPENLAANQQGYYFQIGRLQLRLKDYDSAWKTFDRMLALESLDPMATDFHRAWARVFRARIALARGDHTTARKEAQAGLAMKCPALETSVAWPDAPDKEMTAAGELRSLLKKM